MTSLASAARAYAANARDYADRATNGDHIDKRLYTPLAIETQQKASAMYEADRLFNRELQFNDYNYA